jgi:hypothetical protein
MFFFYHDEKKEKWFFDLFLKCWIPFLNLNTNLKP